MNFFILFASLFFTITSARLTEEVFYKADITKYTADFCSKVTSNDFILAIKSDRESEKASAFKAFFDGCRNRFLYDAEMAKHVIVQMVYTGNTEYLPILLDRGQTMTSKAAEPTYDNVDMDKEIVKLVEYYLFVVNAFPKDDTRQYFFLLRRPERALAYVLAYTKVSHARMEEVRELLENLSNHPTKSDYVDAKSIDRAIQLVDAYLKDPKTVGNHKFLLPAKVEDDKKQKKHASGSWFMVAAVIMGIGSILAVVLGLLWKFKVVKTNTE